MIWLRDLFAFVALGVFIYYLAELKRIGSGILRELQTRRATEERAALPK